MFQFNTFEDILSFLLSCVVAYVFFAYINGFLDYHYGQGERAERDEAINRMISATTMVFIVIAVWVGYKFILSIV
jgi:hypothetical protein